MNLEDLSKKIGAYPAKVLAVSKGHHWLDAQNKLLEIISAGIPVMGLGENYLEELLLKIKGTRKNLVPWHYIGKLQSRKIEAIFAAADAIHTVSRLKELVLIGKLCDLHPSKRFQFFIQINISKEDQKNGFNPKELPEVMKNLEDLKMMSRLQGFMGMAAARANVGDAKVREQFSNLRKMRDEFLPGKILNMGMSDDYELALDEGSGLLRLGSILFGERTPKN